MLWLKILTMSAMLAAQSEVGLRNVTGLKGKSEVPNEYKLVTGDVYHGEYSSPNEDGVVIKLGSGGFSERIPWAKFTQDTVKKLAAIPELTPMAGPFVDIPSEVKAQLAARRAARKMSFTPKPVSKIELPSGKPEFLATLMSPINLGMLGLLFVGNLFVAFEAAIFRNRPIALVCGVSAVLPVLGPILFLATPTLEEESSDGGAGETVSEGAPEVAAKGGATNLAMAARSEKAVATLQPATYTRKDTEFDRRFFEVKFAGFFRVVLGEAEKEFEIVIKTPRDELVCKRIARITANEMHVQLVKSGGREAKVTFEEITQVQLRHTK